MVGPLLGEADAADQIDGQGEESRISSLARNPDVVCTELQDGAVLLNMESHLYYSLNDTGLEIWNLLDGSRSPAEIAEGLTRSFHIEHAAAQEVASRFIAQLERERLAVASSGSQPAASETSAAPPSAKEGDRGQKFADPQLIKHDEPLHEVPSSPFDPQLPLAE